MDHKRRQIFTHDAKFELKAVDGKPTILEGYAIVWNVLSTDRGGYKVRIKPNAVKFAAPTMALLYHDDRLIIGNTDNATLRPTLDAYGVKVEIELPNTNTGREAAELVGKKYVKGMSFGAIDMDGILTVEQGQRILDVDAFTCDEVSVTPTPSFIESIVDVKQQFSARNKLRLQLEQMKFDACRLGVLAPARK